MFFRSVLLGVVLFISTSLLSQIGPPELPIVGDPCKPDLVRLGCDANLTVFEMDMAAQEDFNQPYHPFFEGCGPGYILQNPHWFAFIPQSDSISFSIEIDDCVDKYGNHPGNGVQFALYSGFCDDLSPVKVQCEEVRQGDDTKLTSAVQQGQLYYIVLDGYGGSACKVTIELETGSFGSDNVSEIDHELEIKADNQPIGDTLCLNNNGTTASIPAIPANSTHLVWKISNYGQFTTSLQNNEYVIPEELFLQSGERTICVRATNGCDTSDAVCQTVFIEKAEIEYRQVSVCKFEEYIIGDDTLPRREGTHLVSIEASTECDRFIEVQLTYLDRPPYYLNADIEPDDGTGSGSINTQYPVNGPYAYKWSNGATSPNISGLQTGLYKLTITNQDGCEESVSFWVPEKFRSTKKDGTYVKTPFQGENEIEIRSEKRQTVDIQVFDLKGQIILNRKGVYIQNKVNISIDHYMPAGVYFYRIIDSDGVLNSGKWVHTK